MKKLPPSLGAGRWQTFIRVIFPTLWLRAWLTGFALAFARALGEYGSVIFISGNIRSMKTEIIPLLIITKLEQYDYAGATAIASVMLVSSFLLLLVINVLQGRRYADLRSASRYGGAASSLVGSTLGPGASHHDHLGVLGTFSSRPLLAAVFTGGAPKRVGRLSRFDSRAGGAFGDSAHVAHGGHLGPLPISFSAWLLLGPLRSFIFREKIFFLP